MIDSHHAQVHSLLLLQALKQGTTVRLPTSTTEVANTLVVEQTEPPDSLVKVTRLTKVELVHPEEACRTSAVSLDPVAGMQSALNSLREMIKLPLQVPEAFERLNLECPKGTSNENAVTNLLARCVDQGTPRCWKDPLSSHNCSRVQCQVLSSFAFCYLARIVEINGAQIYGPYLGQTEEKLRTMFQEAAASSEPCIIFLDEIVSEKQISYLE